MSQRRPWTLEEDNVLQKLYEIEGIQKWSQISRLMEVDHEIVGRNGKQCRERYHNHLKGGIKHQKWSQQEERLLVQLHAEHGNRWSYISKQIQGRPQNCVKNMLYSKMRKSVRQLNRFSYIYYRRALKQIKLTFVNRLIDITETAYKKVEKERSLTEKIAIDIKNDILVLSLDESRQIPEPLKLKTKELIEEIHDFKKDNQKHQRGVTLTKIKKQKTKRKESWEEGSKEEKIEEEEVPVEKKKRSVRIPRVKVETVPQVKKLPVIEQNSTKVVLASKLRSTSTQAHEKSCRTPTDQPRPYKRSQTLRSRVEVMRADSLNDNFLNLMEDQDLDRPIQMGLGLLNMTPSPYARSYQSNWGNAGLIWRTEQI